MERGEMFSDLALENQQQKMEEILLQQIETENKQIEELRAKLPIIEKIPLNVGLEGYNSPKIYGIYKQGGGSCLGVSRDSYKPANLSLFLDTIVNSCIEADVNLDVNKLEYREYKNGKKVTFRIPLKEFEIDSPKEGDILKTSLLFTTGFDCGTKSSLTYSTFRVFCSNGRAGWDSQVGLSFKNTKNSEGKYLLFTEEIIKTIQTVENYVQYLGQLAKKPVTQSQLDDFYLRLTGTNQHEYNNAHGIVKKNFDAIQNAVMIESNNTGMNLFSLNQAITRHATHNLAEVEEDVYFGNAARFIQHGETLLATLN